jgi:hypothetical protein
LLLIVVQPGIEVNAVIETAAAKMQGRNVQGLEQSDADTEIVSGLPGA